MKHFRNIFFLLFISGVVSAQTQMSQQSFNLGDITFLNEDVVDLRIKNISAKDIYILRIEAERTTSIKYTSKSLKSGQPETLRIKLNPSKKGKVNKTVKVYLSSNNEPIVLNFTGNVKAIAKDNKQACPDFRNIPSQASSQQQIIGIGKNFSVILYDEDSDENHIAENRTTTITTNTTTTTRTETTVRAQERKASPKKVRKNPEERRNGPSLGTILFGKQESNEEEKVESQENQTKNPENKVDIETKKDSTNEQVLIKEESPVSIKKTIEPEVSDSNLLDDSFRPNNIVFLIDASTSMKQEQKMDILKEAMIKLLEPLRSTDYISIVTYSGEAKTVLEPTAGNQKEAIAEQIRNLNADGSTNAVKGIKQAITVGKGNFIEGGNNQIFLATDGAFDIGERNQSLRRKIESTAKDGLTIDVLGIKNDNWTNKSLKEIADLGNGSLIRIKSMNGASKVLKEMKNKAAR